MDSCVVRALLEWELKPSLCFACQARPSTHRQASAHRNCFLIDYSQWKSFSNYNKGTLGLASALLEIQPCALCKQDGRGGGGGVQKESLFYKELSQTP